MWIQLIIYGYAIYKYIDVAKDTIKVIRFLKEHKLTKKYL